MSAMPPYQYAGLSTPFSIRLLVVSGSQEAPTYDIEVDIRNKPHFEALSYTWKDYDNFESESPEDEQSYATITIGDVGSLKITNHLASILQQIHGILLEGVTFGRL